MSVLAAVAFLNGDENQPPSSPKSVDQPTTTTTTTTTPTPTSAPVPAPRKLDNNNKPTTAAAIQELNRIRTGGGAGVASLMSKFGQDTPPPKRSISPNKQPQPMNKAPTPPRTPSPTASNQPAVSNTMTSTTEKASLSSRGTTSSECRSTKTTPQTKISSRANKTRTNIDMMIEELTIMYQQSLDECKEAQQQLKQLQSEAETYETDSTKVRDYEIRVEYLAQKLEQVSDERDALEQELASYRANRSNLETPASPVFQHRLSDIFDKRSSADQNEDERENDESNSEFMHGILDAYEEEEEEQEDPDHQEHSMSLEEHVKYLQEQLKASDIGTKMAMQQYISELEKERTETKALRDVVRKQDELIASLESKINSNTPSTTPVVSRPPRKASLASPTYNKQFNTTSTPPLPNQSNVERQLREQLESQRLELEDKRALLTQLLNEREDILKKAKMDGNGGRPGASSFDLLAELARPLDNGRNTPPPTAPPRDPLPPVPNNATASSPSSGRESMPSMQDDASSVTSWSAASAAAAATAVDKHNDSVNDFEAMYANYLDSSEDANEHHLLALRRLEGPEQRSPTTTTH
ncbi:hypothetical protein K492DRAFT_198783 [Lichtheimia hyalospora FSU 10163]|nr:hypothetical protein K492DRAFT_198783 [Lichtheimia hyalospora FSU 10163]